MINAQDYNGDLVGREIMVDAANHRGWFEEASRGSGLDITEIFRVKSVDRFGSVTYVNFVSDRRDEMRARGRYDGCGEACRFNVVEPS